MVAQRRELAKLPLLDEAAVLRHFEANKIPVVHARRLWHYMIQKGLTDWSALPELPKRALPVLEQHFSFVTSRVVKRTDSADGSTTKLLIEYQDGQRIESVIMRYGYVDLASFPETERARRRATNQTSYRSKKRATLCVSSQIGCAMGCTFCATGTMNLIANLVPGEILEQLYHARQIEPISGIVFMGMGEPLDCYDNVIATIQGMRDPGRFSISPSRITISTVGVIPRIKQLIKDAPEVGLALSLHAPNQTLRSQIVPTAKAWPIERLLAATDLFVANQNAAIKSRNRRRHVLVEYVIIRDVNDSDAVAHELGALLKNRDVLLNVIPYNPTAVPYDYKPPSTERVRAFVDIVREGYDVHTLQRQELGQDIASACGQLVIENRAVKAPATASDGCASSSATTCVDGDDADVASDGLLDMEDLGRPSSGAASPAPAKGVTLRSRAKTATTTATPAMATMTPLAAAKRALATPIAVDSATWQSYIPLLVAVGAIIGVRLIFKFFDPMQA
ncbi:hypothetical protein CXG81DRAFT_10493 [Caulochytrium protostelioides]|uniref:Radical SAM core domain-containing protein n=1 Tax=Caulochytrium protostelioides TaxID=1555241 RepID=A0A4P9XBA6_9FUNG|nr:hypothetical protein CXG81DRAFT_10493 [Caulochytrium protostelioides]|eukprot:RKP02678.1 hypothetical protein CXG81DRAFT_10493 [Caulochytrium protostelioides]